MDTLERFTMGGSSLEHFARHVQIKKSLIEAYTCSVKLILKQVKKGKGQPVTLDSSFECVHHLCDAVEASFLHGLKAKLSLSRMLTPVKFTSGASKHNSLSALETISRRLPDFWSVLLILSHNQVNEELKLLSEIHTDVGRCRAWIRLALNESLLLSYFDTLINDTSLLHGFYRPYAFLRDKEHTNRLRNLLIKMVDCTFQTDFNVNELNCWSVRALSLIGIHVPEDHNQSADQRSSQECDEDEANDHLKPIMPAIDALKLLSKDDTCASTPASISSVPAPASPVDVKIRIKIKTLSVLDNAEANEATQPEVSPKSERVIKSRAGSITQSSLCLKKTASGNSLQSRLDCWTSSPADQMFSSDTLAGNSSDMIFMKHNKTKSKEITKDKRSIGESSQTLHRNTATDDDMSYKSLLNSYSKSAVLSTTPDIHDIYFRDIRPKMASDNDSCASSIPTPKTCVSQTNYEPEVEKDGQINSTILDNNKPEVREFLNNLFTISPEQGLDAQDYKCKQCSRPIGLLYGKSRICKFDGFNYCLECHLDEQAMIPARVIHNWDFSTYSVSKANKAYLDLIEQEPLFNLKQINPLLYEVIPVAKECVHLRTQLFYLHAYLFTCQEQVALELRELVSPNDHLFEHIHLYSTADLVQMNSGQLAISLKRSIQTARKHVVSCTLCSQKGFICEICRSPQIIYPFDIDSTYRCEGCKAVFHRHCIVIGGKAPEPTDCSSITSDNISISSAEVRSCPRCLRIKLREKTI